MKDNWWLDLLTPEIREKVMKKRQMNETPLTDTKGETNMLMEPRKNVEARQAAGRRWLEAYAEKTRKGEQEHGESERALAVIVLTHKTSDYLAEHDPQALKRHRRHWTGLPGKITPNNFRPGVTWT